ncbi:MAG: hydroxymethylbilane synthase [Gemmatimonadaceae bacterium]
MHNDHRPSDARAPVRIATRRSELALRQTRMVREAIAGLGYDTEVVRFSTLGDERLDVPLPSIGGKGVFTAELEAALVRGAVDVCVHSLKDLPTQQPEGLDIGAVLPRDDPRDALLVRADVAREAQTFAHLPRGARIGTSSLRRAAMIRHLRPDLQLVDLRGNVPTRLQKLDDGQMEAIVLAAAGLRRLGLEGRITEWLDGSAWLPAPAQGIIAVQVRADDQRMRTMLAHVHHGPSWQAALAERAFLQALEGGCQVPIGALATWRDGALWLTGAILDVEGGPGVRGDMQIGDDGATRAGQRLAEQLLAAGGAPLLARARLMTAAPRMEA